MKTNIGTTDRILRALIGIALIIIGDQYSSWLLGIGGLVFITSVFSWCPIYAPFGWNTHPKKEKQ